MGGISGSRETFAETLIEIAGYKAGVVLTDYELFEILKDEGDIGRILDPDGPGGGRLHSSSFEEVVTYLLYRLGNTPTPDNIPITIELYHKYGKKGDGKLYEAVVSGWTAFLRECFKNPSANRLIDPTPYLRKLHADYGVAGSRMGIELIEGWNRDLHRNPWGRVRNIQWQDTVELKGLFESAGLATQHADFFDQRYIDYLGQNFSDLSRMHWRKFEGLTAEFFQREGFHVQLGPGSNDDGIDLRVYPTIAAEKLPPLMIVQCKRQKQQIDKVLIKSVYADVLHEKASSGLIVTSSTISRGAEATRTARQYPVEVADRATIRSWLDKLRSC